MAPLPIAFVSLLTAIPFCIWRTAVHESNPEDRVKRWIASSSLGPFFRLASVALWSTVWELSRSLGAGSAVPWLGKIIWRSTSLSSFWVAPILGFTLYFVLFQEMSRRLLNEHWSTWGSIRLVWWRLVALALPLLMLACGFDALIGGGLTGILWLALAGITARLGSGFLRLAEGMRLHEAKTGETRNRAFSIARKMGVEIGHVFIVPQGKGHLTNAFASPYAIGVTDNLGKYLTRSQIEYVLAHEVAHAKKKHGRKHLLLTIGIYSLLTVIVFLSRTSMGNERPLAMAVAIVGPIMAMDYLSRRQEYEADRAAAEFTRDPDTAIRALVRLYRASMASANCNQFTQLFLSHPSLMRRVTAIARAGHMPVERVNSILASAQV